MNIAWLRNVDEVFGTHWALPARSEGLYSLRPAHDTLTRPAHPDAGGGGLA
jgi:hypothetical protein